MMVLVLGRATLDRLMRENGVILEAGKVYRSRRGERVLVTAVENTGPRPVHFIVLDGPYKGVGRRDGSRLTIDGRATEPVNGVFEDHLNDLIAEWPDDHAEVAVRTAVKLPEARKPEPRRQAS
jgi:uncharacterized protein involved in tellurium resistance